MNRTGGYLYRGVGLSLLLHVVVVFYFQTMGSCVETKKQYKSSVLVPVKVLKKVAVKPPVKKPEPVKVPVKKKKKPPVKITKKTKTIKPPVSHKRVETKEIIKPEEIKQVFGVTKKTVEKSSVAKTGMGIRVGNTLMKEQEKEYTPPEKVRDYRTAPVFDLTALPAFKVRITPDFPEQLKKQDVEGDVYLSATIDDEGVVTEVRIIKSDHNLFSEAAKKALLASRFRPAMLNGEPVGTVLDDLVYTFVLDD